MILGTIEKLRRDIPNHFIPHFSRHTLKFQRVKVRAYRKRAGDALEATRVQDLATASSILQQLVDEHADDAKLHYNLGVVFEAQGKYVEAEQSYQQANDLKRRELYSDAIKRVTQWQSEVERIVALGMDPQPRHN